MHLQKRVSTLASILIHADLLPDVKSNENIGNDVHMYQQTVLK